MRITNYVMLGIFLMCVVVQYNDPDPIRWMMIYGLALIASLLYAFGRLKWYFSAATALVAFLWAASIVPYLFGQKLPFEQIFGTMKMISEPVEEAREMGGLLIVTVWMVVLTVQARKSTQSERGAIINPS